MTSGNLCLSHTTWSPFTNIHCSPLSHICGSYICWAASVSEWTEAIDWALFQVSHYSYRYMYIRISIVRVPTDLNGIWSGLWLIWSISPRTWLIGVPTIRLPAVISLLILPDQLHILHNYPHFATVHEVYVQYMKCMYSTWSVCTVQILTEL